MYPTRRNVENITRMCLMTGQSLHDGSIGHHPLILIGRYLLLKTGIDTSTGLGIKNIPHFALAQLAVLTLSHLIIGMYLDGEVVASVNELDQKRHPVAITPGYGTAKHLLGGIGHNLRQRFAGPNAIGHHAGRALNGAHLPALAYMLLFRKPLPSAQPVAAPHNGVQVWLKQ